MPKNKGSKDPSSRQPTTVREDVVEEEETDYQQLEDRPSSPSTSLSETSSTSTFGRWKNQYWKRSSRSSASKQPSIASVGSFSQSDDFQKLFDDEENPKKKSASEESEEIYLVKQRHGYCSIGFSVGQLLVLIAMMAGCGVAPMKINPMIGPYPDALSYWGGKNAVNIIDDGEWWRLITPIMLHAGVIHLICNVAVQLETGAFFEREWGSTKWLIIYVVSAVGSSALSVIKMPGAISVGSSGAVMGLFGAKLAEVIVRFCDRDKTTQGRIAHQVRKEQATGVTCSVIVVMLFSFIPFVDWAAHVGGLIAGFCIGVVLFALELQKLVWKIVWLAVGVAITSIYFSITFTEMYSGNVDPPEELRDVCDYYQQYFDDYECKCMINQ